MSKESLCILLPTYNEKENVGFMINSLKKHGHDIIISDCSSDGTAEIARSLNVDVFPRKKPGYGDGLKEALEIAKKRGHTYLLVMDCDRTYPPEYIPEMWRIATDENCDFVNAARNMKDIRPLTRYPNMFHTWLTNLVYFYNCKDVNSGMKLMKIDKYIDKFTASGNDSTVQTIIIAAKNKYKMREISIPYKDRYGDESRGKSKIRIVDGLIIALRVIRDRFRK